MRYILAVATFLYASGAIASPFDFLGGIPDAPGVVQGGSFGLTGTDYYGVPQRNGAAGEDRAARSARMRLHPAAPEKRRPRS